MSVAETVPARHRYLTVPAITGVAYTLSWIAGLSAGAPSPKMTASGPEITAAFAGHQGVVSTQFLFTEGLPAAGLAIVSIALARAAHRSGAVAAGRVAAITGTVAAALSLIQFVLGLMMARSTASGTAHVLFQAVDRADGVKMCVLAVLAAAGAASGLLPRWLRYAAVALAVAIAASGIGYLLLLPNLGVMAYASLPLLLLFVTGTGIILGRTGR